MSTSFSGSVAHRALPKKPRGASESLCDSIQSMLAQVAGERQRRLCKQWYHHLEITVSFLGKKNETMWKKGNKRESGAQNLKWNAEERKLWEASEQAQHEVDKKANEADGAAAGHLPHNSLCHLFILVFMFLFVGNKRQASNETPKVCLPPYIAWKRNVFDQKHLYALRAYWVCADMTRSHKCSWVDTLGSRVLFHKLMSVMEQLCCPVPHPKQKHLCLLSWRQCKANPHWENLFPDLVSCQTNVLSLCLN